MRVTGSGRRLAAARGMQVGRKGWVSPPLGGLGGEGQWLGDLEGQSSPWGRFCLGATLQSPRQSQVQLGTSPVVDGWTQAPGHSHLRSSSSLPRDTRLQDSVQILLPPAHFDLTILPAALAQCKAGALQAGPGWLRSGQRWGRAGLGSQTEEYLRVGPAASPQEDGPLKQSP